MSGTFMGKNLHLRQPESQIEPNQKLHNQWWIRLKDSVYVRMYCQVFPLSPFNYPVHTLSVVGSLHFESCARRTTE